MSVTKKILVVGAATAALIGASVTSASASSNYYSYGGNVIAGGCEAWIISDGNSANWAVGIVEGPPGCIVQLTQRNVNNPDGAWAYTQLSDNETTPLYHNDGVHQLRVTVTAPDGAGGPGAWVN